MLALYKQYLLESDLTFINNYIFICQYLSTNPIVFTDKISVFLPNIIDIPIFHTLYTTRVNLQNLGIIIGTENDIKILNDLHIGNDHIFSITMDVDAMVSNIRSKGYA